ncbi:hypothetical protein SRB5_67330 [Streptomyces sp. RB5]|uniref:THIF-type NAD/FAD binding fold domain-containing protein n=1 Tax=Streptomyces smaragdinus TaxID=2585196 RepID=A0A7K0CV45_9ACTN|nr:ThiF family adenylyltransferase [Streptomyces smaragdinus]MQY16534.1 hypothetical protein [Streptomyces smaragdinus]
MGVESLSRPRIKPEHRPYQTVDGHVRIGSVVYGIGAEITDPDGWIWTLVQATDGSRDIHAIAKNVASRHCGITHEDTLGVLEQLYDAGHVEDATEPCLGAFSSTEQNRYSRGVPLLRWMDRSPRASAWQAQLSLKQSRVLLLGVGGTGGYAALALAASGVGSLHCIDYDTVALSNLNRQPLYGESDIDGRKLGTALRRLREINSDIDITGDELRIEGASDISSLLSSALPYDVLVLCADQPQHIRRWTNEACLATGTPWVEGGYRGPIASAALFRPGEGPCFVCLHDAEDERRELRLPPGEDEEIASPRLPWNPVNAVTAGLSGALVAHAALALLTGIPPMASGLRFGINLMVPHDTAFEQVARRPGCPACGMP